MYESGRIQSFLVVSLACVSYASRIGKLSAGDFTTPMQRGMASDGQMTHLIERTELGRQYQSRFDLVLGTGRMKLVHVGPVGKSFNGRTQTLTPGERGYKPNLQQDSNHAEYHHHRGRDDFDDDRQPHDHYHGFGGWVWSWGWGYHGPWGPPGPSCNCQPPPQEQSWNNPANNDQGNQPSSWNGQSNEVSHHTVGPIVMTTPRSQSSTNGVVTPSNQLNTIRPTGSVNNVVTNRSPTSPRPSTPNNGINNVVTNRFGTTSRTTSRSGTARMTTRPASHRNSDSDVNQENWDTENGGGSMDEIDLNQETQTIVLPPEGTRVPSVGQRTDPPINPRSGNEEGFDEAPDTDQNGDSEQASDQQPDNNENVQEDGTQPEDQIYTQSEPSLADESQAEEAQ